MNDFAQTREDDDLFGSEISPAHPPPAAPTGPRALSTRGGRGGASRGYYQVRHDREKVPPQDAPTSPATAAPVARTGGTHNSNTDRTLSGGIKKPKLTEDELAERLARVKLNNQRLVERHRKVAEDENSFQAQEEARKQADVHKRLTDRKKRAEADKSRKELDDEREKNRQRKLKAVQTREWDSTKTEEDYNPKNQSSRYQRGVHGAVAGPPKNAPTGPRSTTTTLVLQNPAGPAQMWPELPAKTQGPTPAADAGGERGNTAPETPGAGESSWAEQVEAGSPVVNIPTSTDPTP